MTVCFVVVAQQSDGQSCSLGAPHTRTLPIRTDVCRVRRLAGRVVWNAPDPTTTRQLATSQDRQAGSTKSQAVAGRKARESAAFPLGGRLGFRTALIADSQPGKRSMLEPRWRPVQVKLFDTRPPLPPARIKSLCYSFTFQSRERTDGRTYGPASGLFAD